MKIVFKEKIVCFIDVLGFSKVVLTRKYEIIQEYYSYIENKLSLYLEKSGVDKNEFYYLAVSDSILIIVPHTKSNILELFKQISIIQSQLLAKKILIRGSIVIGDVFFNRERGVVVGPAIIKAYNLERLADYPRIIIDRESLSGKFVKELRSGECKLWLDFREFDSENSGYISVDYVKYLCRTFRNYKAGRFDKILELLSENIYDNNNYGKYVWLKNKLIYWLRYQIQFYNNKRQKEDISKDARKMLRIAELYLPKIKKL